MRQPPFCTAPNNTRIYALDWLRVIAAISVVMYHYIPLLPEDSIPMWLTPFQYGYLGVEFFFIISGFVILMSAEGSSTWSFFTSRVTRIYPALWICASITAITALSVTNDQYEVSLGQYIANLTLWHRQFSQTHLDGVYWTLTVELRFYLIIGFFIWLKRLKQLPSALNIWLLVCSISLVLQDNPSKLLYWGSYFIAGAYFYYIYKYGVRAKNLIPLFMAFLCSLYQAYDYTREGLSQPIAMAIVSSFYFIFSLIIFKTSTWSLSGSWARVSVAFGAMTYPLYLVHQNVGNVLFNQLSSDISPLLKLLIVTSTMVTVSFLIALFLEPRLRIKLKYKLNSFKNNKATELTTPPPTKP